MFWSLELYVNAVEAYANQDWKLQTPQKNFPKHLKKISPNTSKKFPIQNTRNVPTKTHICVVVITPKSFNK